MLSDKDIEKLIQPILDRQDSINRYVIEKIAQRVKEIGHLLPSDVYKLERLLKTGSDVREINKEIARLTGLNEREIKQLIKKIAEEYYKDAKPYYDYRHKSFIPFEKNKPLQRIVNAIASQTAGTYMNLSRSTAFMLRDLKNPAKLIATPLSKAYQTIIDEAVQAALSGVIDYGTAMRRTMNQLADSGIRNVQYQTETKRIYTQRLDSAVRRNLLDAVKDISQKVQDEIGEEIGADGKEITVHANSAPDHEPIQGHQFTNEEFEKLQNNEPFEDVNGIKFDAIERAIGEYNCRHFTYSIIVGQNKPVYTQAQLNALIEANKKGYTDSKGRHMTKYECTQKQRAMETEIRKHKDRYLALKESGDTEGAKAERARVTQLKKSYVAFSQAAGLSPKTDRLRVSGYR